MHRLLSEKLSQVNAQIHPSRASLAWGGLSGLSSACVIWSKDLIKKLRMGRKAGYVGVNANKARKGFPYTREEAEKC